MKTDHEYMAEALRLARRGWYTAHPNPRVGCVIVRDGAIVGRGWHVQTGGPHAEIVALAEAGDAARGATAYVTLEPCCHHGRTPPCTDALQAAAVARVVIGAPDPNPAVAGRGVAALRAAGIEVAAGVMAADCAALNPGFEMRMRAGRPKVTVKIAASLDGRTALASGDSRWISGEQARADVQRLRAASGAILTGIGTVLADDPRLTVRAADLPAARQPLRVILDSRLRLPTQAQLLALPGETLVASLAGTDPSRAAALEARGAELLPLPGAGSGVDLQALLRALAEREINDVLVEAGPILNGALLDAGLVDELIVYQAPQVLGADARGMFAIRPLGDMAARPEFDLCESRRIGDDLRLRYRPRPGG